MSICLTNQEIKDITGATAKRLQAEALLSMGIPFKIRPDGSLLVSRLAYEKSTGAISEKTIVKTPEPDFDTLYAS